MRGGSVTRTLFLVAVLVAPSAARVRADDAELRTLGDPALRAAVDARTRPIYDAAARPDAKRVFLMTRANPLSLEAARGTEATGVVVEGTVGRIVASVWTKSGKYSVEYYRTSQALLFVYETFVYFEEEAPRGAWRNFMGQAAWERRTYFDDRQSVGFAEARGPNAPPPGADGPPLIDRAQRMARLLDAKSEAR